MSEATLPRVLLLGPVLAAAVAVGCEPRPPKAAVAPDAGEPAATAAEVVPPAKLVSIASLVRKELHADAARAIDGLPDASRAAPELRYLRARLAVELGDGALAWRLFEGLERTLPLLAQDVSDRRADAAFVAGRFKDAAEYFATRAGALFQLKASRAFERGLDAVRARAAANRVVGAKASRTYEAEARARRLRLGGRTVREDAEDARWLAIEAPDLADGEGALGRLAALEPARPLTWIELQRRARVLGDAGLVDEALKTLESGPKATNTALRLERLRAKGDIYYRSRSHYLLAARTFDEVVNLAGPTALEDVFKAARSLSRADRDDEAIERFLVLARRAPRSPWGEEALFLAGRLHLLHGRFTQSAAIFDEHHKKHGSQRKEAARMRALAHLLSTHHTQAIRLFEELSDDEREPLAAARARTMAALAASRSGDRTLAIARYGEVARSRPLTWPSLVARARLAELRAPIPSAFEGSAADNGAVEPLAITLPPPVDMLHRLGLDEDAESALREREAAIVAVTPGRSTESLCIAYGMIGRGKRRYQIAQQIPQQILMSPPTPKTRWAWECAYPSPFSEEVTQEEKRLGLTAGVVLSIMRQESGFDPDAVSPARAVGLLQLIPDTGKAVASQLALAWDEKLLLSPTTNVRLGARYLRDLVDRFRGNVPLALAGYNGGPDNVAKWLGRLRDLQLDVFVEQIPYAETRGYVVRVMGNLARYAFLSAGEEALPTLSLSPLEAAP